MTPLKAVSFAAAASLTFTGCSFQFTREYPKSKLCIEAEERLISATSALTLAEITVLHNPAALADGTLEARRAAYHTQVSVKSDVAVHCTP
jgi:hypothetical protein